MASFASVWLLTDHHSLGCITLDVCLCGRCLHCVFDTTPLWKIRYRAGLCVQLYLVTKVFKPLAGLIAQLSSVRKVLYLWQCLLLSCLHWQRFCTLAWLSAQLSAVTKVLYFGRTQCSAVCSDRDLYLGMAQCSAVCSDKGFILWQDSVLSCLQWQRFYTLAGLSAQLSAVTEFCILAGLNAWLFSVAKVLYLGMAQCSAVCSDRVLYFGRAQRLAYFGDKSFIPLQTSVLSCLHLPGFYILLLTCPQKHEMRWKSCPRARWDEKLQFKKKNVLLFLNRLNKTFFLTALHEPTGIACLYCPRDKPNCKETSGDTWWS